MHEILPKKIATRANPGERVDVVAEKDVDTLLPLQGMVEPATAEGKP